MANSLVELPIELLEKIFAPLDDNSLLEMRKVCKATKTIAEVTVLNRTESPAVIDWLRLFGEVDCNVLIKYEFDDVNSHQSKLFVVSAIGYLQITGFIYQSDEMIATMSPTETASFFDRLTPFMRNATCIAIEFFPSTPEMFSRISSFLEGKTIPHLSFELIDSDQSKDFCLQIVGQFESSKIRLLLDVSVLRIAPFLTHLAGIVDMLKISTPSEVYKEFSHHSLFSGIRNLAFDMFKQRCYYLDLTDAFIEMPLEEAIALSFTLEDITWKEIYFTAPSDEPYSLTYKSTQMVSVVEDGHMPTGTRIEIGNRKRS